MNKLLAGRTVLITGATGGLGEQFVDQALKRGVDRVYAASRTPRSWDDTRVTLIELDITNPADVAEAVTAAPDVDLLINNAGIAPAADIITGPEDDLRAIFETNFFGTMRLTNAFSPILAANGGGTILNILSASSWLNLPTGYAASKAAMWSATNALRTALKAQNTEVIGLQVGMIDTPMTARWDVPKISASHVVAQAYDAITNGAFEVLADELTRQLKSRLSLEAEVLYPWIDEQLATLTP